MVHLMGLMVAASDATSSDPVPLGIAFGLGPLLMAAGALVSWVGLQSQRGELARNALVGIRTPDTLRSDEAWLTGHRAGGPWMIGAGLAPVLAGLILLFRPSNGLGVTVIMGSLAIMVGLVAVGAFVTNGAARQTS